MNTNTIGIPSYPARPNVDAILNSIMSMVQECLKINTTGKTYEMILEEARSDLYASLDCNMGGLPTTKPTVNWHAEYLFLYKRLEDIQNLLGIQSPRPDGINPGEIHATLVGLMSRIAELQRAATPAYRSSDGRPWSIADAGLIHLIRHLVKP